MSVVASDVLSAAAPALAPGELFAVDLSAAPLFGCHRQGGANEINRITDARLGDCLEFTTGDNDHNLPGNNAPGPYGGPYSVHRKGGVASCLIAPKSLMVGQKWYIRLRVAIPSSQPGLPGGFPTSMARKWLSLHEAYGPPFLGAPVTALMLGDDPQTGKLSFCYGPQGQPVSFWTPLVLDEWFDFLIELVPSTDPKVGGASVTVNGTPLKSRAGNVWQPYSTIIASDINAGALLCYAQNYRSPGWGGTVRTLLAALAAGSTAASVAGGSSSPPPPVTPPPVVPPPVTPPPVTPPPVTPPPVTPPPVTGGVTLTLTAAQATALSHYIGLHGIPAGDMGPLISQIVAEL